MKNLTLNQLEKLNGGVCGEMPEASPISCRPNVCFGLAVAAAASGNPNLPIVFCPA